MTQTQATEPRYLSTTRAAYDTVAADYAELLRTALEASPFDRAMLDVFAELVSNSGEPSVVDVGCGPGRITAHLHSLGLSARGVDLSPGMVATARRLHPELRFEEGSMTALDIEDGTVGGVVAWYSVIHIPPEDLPVVFAEFRRVLGSAGLLLLAFQAGNERRHIDHAYGHSISLDAYRLPPDHIVDLLAAAGFVVQARLLRAPEGMEKTEQAYLLVRKSGP